MKKFEIFIPEKSEIKEWSKLTAVFALKILRNGLNIASRKVSKAADNLTDKKKKKI